MKNKKLLLLIPFLVYIILSMVLYGFKGKENPAYSYSYENGNGDIFYIKDYKKDNTIKMNRYILQQINDLNWDVKNRSANFKDTFISFNLPFENMYYKNVEVYFTNKYDVEKLIKDNNITNKNKIDYTKTKYTLPIGDKNYEKFFNTIPKDKKEANIIGKEKNGYNKFDISPDTIILQTYKNDIISYAIIDNRLIDGTELMNKSLSTYYDDDEKSRKDVYIKKVDKGQTPYKIFMGSVNMDKDENNG